jgi:hypothetical protein
MRLTTHWGMSGIATATASRHATDSSNKSPPPFQRMNVIFFRRADFTIRSATPRGSALIEFIRRCCFLRLAVQVEGPAAK